MTPEEIVKGLRPAQIAWIEDADTEDPFCHCCAALYEDDLTHQLLEAYPAHQDPNHEDWEEGGTRWSWSEKGQSVRALLEKDGI